MTNAQIERLLLEIVKVIRERAPKDTGNLAFNSIKYYRKDKNTFVIYVDEGNGKDKGAGVAPYMKYTNENWNLFRPPLRGKKNQNEGWWQDAVQQVINYLINNYGGKLNDNN